MPAFTTLLRRWLASALIATAGAAQAATPILSNGPPRTQAQEDATKLTALSFHLTLAGDGDPQKAADTYLATDFRNHNIEQPSSAQTFADYFLKPAELGNPAPLAPTPPFSPAATRRLFAITDGDLTMMVFPAGGGGDPSLRFTSLLMEIKHGKVTQLWSSGPADPSPDPTRADDLAPWFAAPGPTIGRMHILVSNGAADRTRRDANKALVETFIREFFLHGDDAAARRDLAPDIISHAPGVPSGAGFAAVARKHPERVTAPDVQSELFALADGELVDIGYPVAYAGDPGAWYAQSIARVRGGRIVEWWYSGYPSGHPHVWQKPK